MSCVAEHTEILLSQRPLLDSSLDKLLNDENADRSETACDSYCLALDDYLELSTLLDPILPAHTTQLCDSIQKHLTFVMSGNLQSNRRVEISSRALYTLCKVRRMKPLTTHFPHEVSHLRFLLPSLHFITSESQSAWQIRYVLLVWASVAIRIPFPLLSVVPSDVIELAIEAARKALRETSRVSDVAAIFLARLLSRRDTNDERDMIIQCALDDISANGNNTASALSLLAAVFKYAHRDDLKSHITRVLSVMESFQPVSSTQAHRTAKLVHRIALAFLPPRPASWRYSRAMPHLLSSSSKKSHSSSTNTSHIGEIDIQQYDEADYDGQLNESDAERLESVIDMLFDSLRHTDAIVRYSAAKGIARMTARLPRDHSIQLVYALLDIISTHDEIESNIEAAIHGGCLSIAELSRRGLLLPNDGQLGRALKAVRQAARFEPRRSGGGGGGAQVRDAACFAIWAIARAYDKNDIEQFVHFIINAIVPVALVDREVNCRRAASAALQECVGRFSTNVFPDGIQVITIADYFSLGDRNAAFLSIVPKIAALGKGVYVDCIIEELHTSKLVHWDSNIRILAAKALALLVQYDEKCSIEKSILPKLIPMTTQRSDAIARHGALLGMSELVVKFGRKGLKNLAADTRKIPMLVNEKGFFHGRTGDDMQMATCQLIRNLSEFAPDVYTCNADGRTDAERAMQLLERLLSSGKEKLYAEASAAYEAMFLHIVSQDVEWHVQATERVLTGLNSSLSEFQRGFALALGSCGDSKISEKVVDTLCHTLCNASDVEVRRNAGKSLAKIPMKMMLQKAVNIMQALSKGMKDYAKDERGDVGSWIREACMTTFATIVECLLKHLNLKDGEQENDGSKRTDVKCIEGGILAGLEDVVFECCGRIDRTRVIAGKSLKQVCCIATANTIDRTNIKELNSVCAELNQIFRFRHNDGRNFDDFYGSEVTFENGRYSFPAMQRALNVSAIRGAVMRGFVSAGGGTRSQFRAPCEALVSFFQYLSDSTSKTYELRRAILAPISSCDKALMTPALIVLAALAREHALDTVPHDVLCDAVHYVRTTWRGRFKDVKLVMAGMDAIQDLLLLSLNESGAFEFPKGSLGCCGLEALAVVLGCGIPRLRTAAAQIMYTALILCDIDGYAPGCHEGVLPAMDVLLDVPWNVVSVKEAREKRNDVCRLLNINAPTPVVPSNNSNVKSSK